MGDKEGFWDGLGYFVVLLGLALVVCSIGYCASKLQWRDYQESKVIEEVK